MFVSVIFIMEELHQHLELTSKQDPRQSEVNASYFTEEVRIISARSVFLGTSHLKYADNYQIKPLKGDMCDMIQDIFIIKKRMRHNY